MKKHPELLAHYQAFIEGQLNEEFYRLIEAAVKQTKAKFSKDSIRNGRYKLQQIELTSKARTDTLKAWVKRAIPVGAIAAGLYMWNDISTNK